MALALPLTAPVPSAEAGHVSAIDRGLFGQGLLPGSTGLDAPLGDPAPTTSARSTASAPDAAGSGRPPLRVYVVVVDGLRPQEVGPLTPTLSRLRAQGTWYKQARSVLPAETLPNHAAMATGMLPQRNGIVANQIFRGDSLKEYMQYPEFWEADTLTTRLERAYGGAVSTATVLAKEYLYGLFIGEHEGPGDPLPQREADFHWDPRTAAPFYVDDPSDHTMDPATMNAFLGWIDQDPALPQFAFVNLADVDRAGHADESGVFFAGEEEKREFPDELTAADVSPFRQAAIEAADSQIGRLVSQLEDMGAWDETVLIVLSDHGMDWGFQDKFPDNIATLRNAGYRHGTTPANSEFFVVGGGGSELIYVHHEKDIADIAEIVNANEGVEFVATEKRVPDLNAKDNPTRRELGIEHPNSPEIEVFTETGYHSDPNGPGTNPLPGNHGHSVTQHAALLVAGGHPALRAAGDLDGPTVFDRDRKQLFVHPAGGPGVLSVAPTVAALFGVGDPAGGYDGAPLTQAFDPGTFPSPGGPAGPGGGAGPSGGGSGPGAAVPEASSTLTTTLAARPGRPRYGQRVVLSGRVTGGPACGGPLRVSLHRGHPTRASAAQVLAMSIPPRAGGHWSHAVTSLGTSTYFARVQPTRSCEGSLSRALRLPARARVGVAARCGRGASARGRVFPGARGSRVVLERLRAGRYRRIAAGRLDRASRFRFRLPSCLGRYRVVWPAQRGLALTGSANFTIRGARG